jgi:predicted dehydrogenase
MSARQNTNVKMTRRNFLRGTAAVGAIAAFPAFVPSSVFGADAPSNRINLAAIGVGSRGMGNMNNFMEAEGTQMVVICDVEKYSNNYGGSHKGRELGRDPAVRRVNEYYAGQKDMASYKGCDSIEDFREIIGRKDIDAVIVTTPDHWHVPISIAAVESGKDVYCEKPLTLTISEGRLLADAVKKHNRVFQTGSQQRSSEFFRQACEAARNGRIGKISRVVVGIPDNNVENPIDWKEEPIPPGFNYNLWLGPAPAAPYTTLRCHYTFRFLLDYSGGQITNFGAHNLDIAQWGLDMDNSGPVEVQGTGEAPKKGLFSTYDNVNIDYRYANGVVMNMKTGGGGGIKFIGADGWVHANREKVEASSPDVLKAAGPNEIHLYKSDDHRLNFLECIRTRKDPICTAEIGHRSATLCHLGNIALMLGRKLNWDPAKEEFPNDWPANNLRSRKMRNPWNL